MLLHVLVYFFYEVIVKYLTTCQQVDSPLYPAHVQVTLLLKMQLLAGYGILAENIERQTVGDNHRTHHQRALVGRIVLQIERIVGTQVFVQTDAQRPGANDDALVEGAYLCINVRQVQMG